MGMSDGTYWDSVSAFPAGFSPLHNMVMVNKDNGDMYPCNADRACPGETTFGSPDFSRRAWTFHLAVTCLKGTRRAMRNQVAASMAAEGKGEAIREAFAAPVRPPPATGCAR